MPNRDTWDWQDIEPDQTVTMTLIFNRTPKDDGRKEGADYDWHRYPVSVGKSDWTMFTPSEFMHSALQALGVDKKGDIFRATKKLGYNKDTGKSYTYYELERDGTKLRTDQVEQPQRIIPKEPPGENVQNLTPSKFVEPTPPTETPQQQVEKVVKETATELNGKKQSQPTLKEIHKQAYEAVMDNILEYAQTWCPVLFDETQGIEHKEQRVLKLILDLQPHIGSQVNTLVIQNGSKR